MRPCRADRTSRLEHAIPAAPVVATSWDSAQDRPTATSEMQSMTFQDRTVIVTGGTGALGRAVVGSLLANGARCRVPYIADTEVTNFPHEDGVTLVNDCDLSEESDVARLYDGVTDLCASIHIAGGFAMGSIDETDRGGLLAMLNTNLIS